MYSSMSFTGVSALAIVLTSAAFAQSGARPEFEVASIRASVPLGQGHVNVGLHIDGAQVRGRCRSGIISASLTG
jgi:hypothetical protein